MCFSLEIFKYQSDVIFLMLSLSLSHNTKITQLTFPYKSIFSLSDISLLQEL